MVLYVGELATDRHYYWVGANNETARYNRSDYVEDAFERCREEFGGRLAWLDTPEVSL